MTNNCIIKQFEKCTVIIQMLLSNLEQIQKNYANFKSILLKEEYQKTWLR